MYGTPALTHRALDDLVEPAGQDAIDELRRLARPIEGLRVLNLSVTGFGTGTAELLNSSVPLMNDLGLDAQWQVVRASEEDLSVTQDMYRALGGVYVNWTQEMTDRWLRYAQMNAELLTEPFDVIVVHDPQPLALRSFTEDRGARWLAHSHLDLSTAQEDVWLLLRHHLEKYDAIVFDARGFTREDLPVPVRIIPPAIDPNSARNMPLPDDVVHSVLEQYGIDPARPMICQVSPCDPACDLTGVVESWQAARRRHPGLQLAVVLTTDPFDPAGRSCYETLARVAHDEPDMTLVSSGMEFGNVELNVFQRAAAIVIQKGLRKGYGLWVADALWKERPCIVAASPGLQEQVIDGESGLVVHSTEECAAAIVRLLDHPDEARALGKKGREHVAKKFLITRYLRDYMHVLTDLHGKN